MPVTFAPLTGDDVRVTVTGVRPVTTIEFHEQQPIVMPVALAEVGIPGVQRAALPARFPDTCRDDLLTVDGAPMGIRLDGDPAAAAAGGAVDFELCDPDVRADRGQPRRAECPGCEHGHRRRPRWCSARRRAVTPMPLGAGGDFGAQVAAATTAGGGDTPRVKVVENGRTKMEVHVDGAVPGQPFWLVLGRATARVGAPTVDGQAGSPDPRQRLRQRLAGHTRERQLHRDARMDAAAHGMDRARDLRRRAARCASRW